MQAKFIEGLIVGLSIILMIIVIAMLQHDITINDIARQCIKQQSFLVGDDKINCSINK